MPTHQHIILITLLWLYFLQAHIKRDALDQCIDSCQGLGDMQALECKNGCYNMCNPQTRQCLTHCYRANYFPCKDDCYKQFGRCDKGQGGPPTPRPTRHGFPPRPAPHHRRGSRPSGERSAPARSSRGRSARPKGRPKTRPQRPSPPTLIQISWSDMQVYGWYDVADLKV